MEIKKVSKTITDNPESAWKNVAKRIIIASENKLKPQKSVSLLDTYADSLKGFFDAWKEMWKN